VRHVLNPPASSSSIVELHQMLGSHAGEVQTFFESHDGFILYGDTLSDAAGIELLPIEQWKDATDEMRQWYEHLSEEPDNDPDHILTGIAIATVPQSGNYFVMPVEGPTAGKIFYADHDGWYEAPFADDLTTS
jgi:hypothetical protein